MEQRVILFPSEERIICCVYFLLPIRALCWIFTAPVGTPEVMLQSSSAQNSWVNRSDEEMKMTFRKRLGFFCFLIEAQACCFLFMRTWKKAVSDWINNFKLHLLQWMPGCCWQVQHIFTEKNKSSNEGFKDSLPHTVNRFGCRCLYLSAWHSACGRAKSIKAAWRESEGKTHSLPLLLVWGTAPDNWLKLDNEYNFSMFATFS